MVTAASTKAQEARQHRFKWYSSYKESRVQWLGRIPGHWSLKRLKHIAQFRGGGTPSKDNIDYWRGDIPWVSPKDMKVTVVSETEDNITMEAVRQSATKLVPAGAVLMVVRSGILIHTIPVAISGREVTLNQDLKALIPKSEVLPSYLMYLISGMQMELLVEWKKEGATVESLELDLIANTPIPLPPISEQRGIATFLDRETARIDALVAKNERLIELLQERRTALISSAVTEGLDPNVPMKESGVPWLGKVPDHWNVMPLKRAVEYVEGPGIMAADFAIEGVPLLRISGIGGRTATLDGCNYLLPALVEQRWKHFRVRLGDLLISGSASTGFCSLVDAVTEGAVPYTGIIIVRPRVSLMRRAFVQWFLLSESFLTQVELARSGSTIQHFGPSHLSRMFAVVPPIREQEAIVDFLDREFLKIDALIAKVRGVIAHLDQLRRALMSAAVTGKIDVRAEVA